MGPRTGDQTAKPIEHVPRLPRMKAVVRRRPGVMEIAELPEPTEHVVQIKATSLNRADWHMGMAKPWPLRLMKIPIVGLDVAGVVVDGLEAGKEVMGECGTSGYGGHAEQSTLRPDHRARKPKNVSFEEAACIPTAGLTALQGLRDWGQMRPGRTVLVNGASGGVGSFAVQVARILGARHVTAMCGTKNVEFVEGLGADEVWDYTQREIDGTFDVVFDAAACRPLRSMRKHLTPGGKYVLVGGQMKYYWQAMLFGKMLLGNQLGLGTAKADHDDLEQLADWVEAGKLRVPLTKTISMEEVAEAIVRLGDGRTVGKVAVRIASP